MLKNRPFLRMARPGLVLGIVVTVLMALGLNAPLAKADIPDFPDGYPTLGPSEENVQGLSVNGQVTTLFPLHVGPDQISRAYCVELTVSARQPLDVGVGDWESFPGDNNFATSETVREKVAWIVYNSYPNLSLEAYRALTEVPGLTEEEAIAATQAAIWHFTDGFAYQTSSGSDAADDRVRQVYDHMTGDENTGRPETVGPSLSLEVVADQDQAGDLVGPIRITSSEETAAVTVTGDYPLVTSDGEPVDLSAVPTGVDLWFDVPATAPAGSASLSAAVTGPESTGLLVTNTEPRTQTLMIARGDVTTHTDDGVITWRAKPRITTEALDQSDGDDYLAGDDEVTVVDTVTYAGLVPGERYRLEGELMIRNADGTSTATGITQEMEFTPTEPSGSVELAFTIPASQLQGEVVVVFEELFQGKQKVAVHADIDDEDQTVYRPRIGTTARDGVEGDKLLPQDGEAKVTDTVAYEGLKPGREYTLAGTLVTRDADGKPVDTGITAERTFTPEASDGSVELTFTVPDGMLRGETIVVFEELYDGATLVATHADIDDDFQTVYRPRLGTSASDAADGDKHLAPTGEVTVDDVVTYSGLEPGKEYTLKGELMVRDGDGNAVPTGITQELTFTPTASSGTETLSFTIPAGELHGETIVVFESLQRDGVEVAVHADIDDQDQTVHRPRLGTSATDGEDGDDFLAETDEATIVDTVTYEGLRVGQEYTVRGELMIRTADGTAQATGITSEVTFTPQSADGSVDLQFTVAEGQLLGTVIVVFEHLWLDDIEVAAHADITDEDQTVHRPSIDTDAYDLADGDRLLDADGGTLRDDVSYAGLKIGETYVVRGTVMLYETGQSTGIHGATTFVATQSAGIVHVDFDIPDTYARQTLVVFEWLYLVPRDADRPDDQVAGQDTDRGQNTDRDQDAAPAALAEPTAVTGLTTFGGAAPFDGWVTPVDDEADTGDGSGADSAESERLLATHTDLNAERQTVRVDAPPPPPELPNTGSTAGTGWVLGLGALLTGGGAALLLADRRRRHS